MNLFIDTHILLWSLIRTEKLNSAVRDALEDTDNAVFFSVISIWEIGIKAALRRDDFDVDPAEILSMARATGFIEQSIDSELAIMASRLPPHHRDPFDRMLFAQAMQSKARFITADTKLAQYSDTVWLI